MITTEDREATNDVEGTETEENDGDDEAKVHDEAPVKIASNPAECTPKERARQDATHLSYRAWCPVCVEARATEDPPLSQ